MLLHGYEDEPADLFGLRDRLDPGGSAIMLAPTGPVRAPGGPAWFTSSPDDEGPPLVETIEALGRLVKAACGDHRVDPSATRVVGYSQGAAMALAFGFGGVETVRPARIAAHAAWLTGEPSLSWDLAGGAGRTAVLLTHGVDDEVVPLTQGRSAARALERSGVDVDLVEIDAGHSLADLPTDAIARWLASDP